MHGHVSKAFLVVALTAAAGVGLSGCNRAQPGHAGAPGGAAEVGVVTVTAQALAVTTELAGRTSPYLIAEVRPQVSGIVQKRNFTEGGEVRANEALYQIDPATYAAADASARAALAKAEANASSARAKAERYKELVTINAVSKQDNDDAQAAAMQAAADVLAAKAALNTAQINLAYTRVAAPISGRISRSSVTPGALVTANQATALATVQQLDPIYVDLTQSSSDLLRLKNDLAAGALKRDGQAQAKVKLKLEDGSLYPLEGKLQFSDVTVDQNTGTVNLRAVFPNPQKILLPGMYVRALVEEGVRDQAIVVPQQGVSRDPKGQATAMVVGADSKAEVRVLTTGRTLGDKWLVTSGLKPGDKLIVDGLQKIAPGAPVKPVDLSASAPAAAK